jgi:hypothetical protein
MFRNLRFDAKARECHELAGPTPRPVMGVVSMSSWLSQSVRAKLDSQLCDTRNRKSLSDLMTRLAQKPQ